MLLTNAPDRSTLALFDRNIRKCGASVLECRARPLCAVEPLQAHCPKVVLIY